jgi:hypothetical protein
MNDRVLDVLDISYWKRMWSIPEVVLAQRGTVLISPFSFPVSVLEELIRLWRTNQSPEHILMGHPRLAYLRAIVALRLDYKAGRQLSLAEILCRFCQHWCENPRDKIYSLLDLVPGIDEHLKLDYGKSTPMVFLDAARVTLLRNYNLNVLSHVSRPTVPGSRLQESMPSWLPTYEDRERHRLLTCDQRLWHFSAGGVNKPVIEQHRNESGQELLGVRGFVVDTIALRVASSDPYWQHFSTSSGANGWGTEHVQAQDTVVIFSGGPVPYILRKKLGRKTWTFIGEW